MEMWLFVAACIFVSMAPLKIITDGTTHNYEDPPTAIDVQPTGYFISGLTCNIIVNFGCKLILVKHTSFSDRPIRYVFISIVQKRIKTENVQDSSSQKIFDLEKLVFYWY